MKELGAPVLYLPQMTTKDPKSPCLPIFATRQTELKTKKSVIVVVNDHFSDLGVWAYRVICDNTGGFDKGSCTGLAKDIKASTAEAPGLLVLNPGQYYYSFKENRALNHESWSALPKKSLFHPEVRVDEAHNLVPHNGTRVEHISFIFDNILANEAWVDKDADIYIMGICEGGNSVINYLHENWDVWSSRVNGAAWVNPYTDRDGLRPDFKTFLETRTRSWTVSGAPLNTCRGMPTDGKAPVLPEIREWEDDPANDARWTENVFCPTFSSGQAEFAECVFAHSYNCMLDFFAEINEGGATYENPPFVVAEPPKPELVVDEEEGQENGTELTRRDADQQGTVLPGKANGEAKPVKKEVEGEDGSKMKFAGEMVDRSLLQATGFLD